MNRTWFDRFVFDREWYRLLKPRHPNSTVPYILPINCFLFMGSGVLIGVLVGSWITGVSPVTMLDVLILGKQP